MEIGREMNATAALLNVAVLLFSVQGFQTGPLIKQASFPLAESVPCESGLHGCGYFYTRKHRGSTSLRERRDTYFIDGGTGGNNMPRRNQSSRPMMQSFAEKVKRVLFNVSQSWFLIKKAIRALTEKYTIYVLECENDKYYVGSTSHKRQRFKQHIASKRGGSKWTRIHKPVRVARQYKRVPSAYYLGLEAKVTAEYMLKHGVNDVRGAMFAQCRQFNIRDDLDALVGFLGHYNNMNYQDVSLMLQRELPPPPDEYVPINFNKKKMNDRSRENDVCNRCGKRGHWAADCPNKPFRCFSCGKVGHYAADCPLPREMF